MRSEEGRSSLNKKHASVQYTPHGPLGIYTSITITLISHNREYSPPVLACYRVDRAYNAYLLNDVQERQRVGPCASRVGGEAIGRFTPNRFLHCGSKLDAVKAVISHYRFPEVVPVVAPKRQVLRYK